MANDNPVVLVHGVMGFGPKELGPLNYWGSAFKVPSPLTRYEASVGPISSAHDRACELAAQIKGTRVDYGEQHATSQGHERYGYDFTGNGFVADWSPNNPVHLVGHSMGSPTIRCLHQLLASDYWEWGSNDKWIKSISTISGVSNGSTLTYFFGADEQTGLIEEKSLSTALLRIIEVFTAATGTVLDTIYNFDLDHWGFERRQGESLEDYLARVSQSPFFKGKDNAVYSLTLQGAYEANAVWQTYPDAYYFSYITEQTTRGRFSGRYYPDPRMNAGLSATSLYIGHKVFDCPPIPVTDFKSSDWWENDGAVSTYSQKYPHTNGNHPIGSEFTCDIPTVHFQTGEWYYQWQRGMDHLDICISPQLTQIGRQRRFYIDLFQRLAAL